MLNIRVAFSLFCLFLSVVVYAQPVDPQISNDPLTKKLNGKVRTIKSIVNRRDDRDSRQLRFAESTIVYFNDDNLVTQFIRFDYFGSKETTLYAYDSAGHLVSMKILDGKDRLERDVVFYYNKSGELMRRLDKPQVSENIENKFAYKNGKMVRQSLVYLKSGDSIHHDYKFDQNGNMVEHIERIPKLSDGTGGYDRTVYQYSKQNLLVTALEYEVNEELVHTTSYTYDKTGALIRSETRNAAGDAYDNVKTYRYEDGNLIALFDDYKDDNLDEHTSYTYQFDKYRNVVLKKVFHNDILVMEIHNEITYR